MEKCTNVYSITVGELCELVDNGIICLNLFAENNDIQRNDVWGIDKKTKFIDTLLDDDMSAPTLIFVKKDDYYMVVDGKQRISSTVSYVNDDFKLNSNTSCKNLIGRKFSKLSQEEKNILLNKRLSFQDIPFKSETQLKELFIRFNSGEKLKPIEIWRASLGNKLPFLNEMVKHEVFKYLEFTNKQLMHFADIETALDFILEQQTPGSDHNKKTKEAYAISCGIYDEFSANFKNHIIMKLDYMKESLMLGKDEKIDNKKVLNSIVKSANKILIFRLVDEAINLGMSNKDFYLFIQDYFLNPEFTYDKIAGTTSTSNKSSLIVRYNHLLKELKKIIRKVA